MAPDTGNSGETDELLRRAAQGDEHGWGALLERHRARLRRLVGVAWVLVALFPVWRWTALVETLRFSLPGYWMLLAGTLLVAAGSVRLLMARDSGIPGDPLSGPAGRGPGCA